VDNSVYKKTLGMLCGLAFYLFHQLIKF